MTDGGGTFQPGAEEVTVPFQPRARYVGHRAFGSGDGAVLIDRVVIRKLRSAAEFAALERRVAGGLLYGRRWADDQGAYLVIGDYLEAGPGENSGDKIRDDGTDDFTLSEADLRLLREDAARMFSGAYLEAGWWRTRAALGEFGPQDFATQARLAGPDRVGLLVYGSGVHWGTAYLGPDGHAPDSAGTLAAVEPVIERPAEAGPAPVMTPPSRRRVRRQRAVKPASLEAPAPATPADVQFVVWALGASVIGVAVIIGVLVSSTIVALVIAAIGLLAVFATIWLQRR